MLAARAFLPFEQLAGGWRQLGLATSAAANLNALLTTGAAAPLRTRLPPATGRLSIEGLVLGYDRRVVVEGLSLAMEPGTFLGIVGPSGSGKSTLAKALVGAVAPLAGTVRLDGAALADWPAEQRADAIGFAPQELDLFEGTIAENIARFRQFLGDNDVSAAVVAAAQLSHAHAMILRLPAGYETRIGHGGEGLSVGQRQRISLARAVFGSPALVVLDEPNAQIDAAGEAALVDMLARLKTARVTLVVVAHRLRILEAADRIVALENGGIVFDGPPGRLFAKADRLPTAAAQRENVA
jgi:ABC-type protease/lipase transport system fused ATPase/permease subunit